MRRIHRFSTTVVTLALVAGAAVAQADRGAAQDATYRAPRVWSPVALSPANAAPLLETGEPTGVYLGRLSTNRYQPDSVANPYGPHGSPYSPRSVNNPHSVWGSPYSTRSATNPYTSRAPRLYSEDGTYLGRLSANPYDADSVSNPYGRYGSAYSPTSIHNPYGRYGSEYSPMSPNNLYSTRAPVIVGEE